MVHGGVRVIKYILFIFNLLFFLAGAALIIAGAVVQAKFRNYLAIYSGGFSGAAAFLIAIGCIVFIIGFFGCCGAYRENHCMVMTYAVLLGLVLLLEIIGCIVAYVMRNQIKEGVKNGMHATINQYNTDKGINETWNYMQNQLDCCGADNYTDWKAVTNLSIPDSCCKIEKPGCGTNFFQKINNTNIINQDSCITVLSNSVEDSLAIIGGVAIGVAVIQLLGIICACVLARSIKRDYEVV